LEGLFVVAELQIADRGQRKEDRETGREKGKGKREKGKGKREKGKGKREGRIGRYGMMYENVLVLPTYHHHGR